MNTKQSTTGNPVNKTGGVVINIYLCGF